MRGRFVTFVRGFVAASLALAAVAAPAADMSKVYRIAFPTAETGFDPARVSDLYSNTVNEAIFERLLTYDYLARPAKLVPMIAEAMPTVTEGGKVYTFKLRKGIHYTPDPAFKGQKRELVAEDYVYEDACMAPYEALSPDATAEQWEAADEEVTACYSGEYEYESVEPDEDGEADPDPDPGGWNPFEDEVDIEATIDELVASGMARDDAECLVTGLVDAFGHDRALELSDESEELTAEEMQLMTDLTLECMDLGDERGTHIVESQLADRAEELADRADDAGDVRLVPRRRPRQPYSLAIDLVDLVAQIIWSKRQGVRAPCVRLDDLRPRIDELAMDPLDDDGVLQIV